MYNVMALTRKVQESPNGQKYVYLPKILAELMDLKKGTELDYVIDSKDNLVITKKLSQKKE